MQSGQMSSLLSACLRLLWTVVNPEESKATSLLPPFPAGIHQASTTEAGAGAGMREVVAGALSSHRRDEQPVLPPD